MQKHLFLIGFMGTGKTAVSEALSARTGIPVMDTDEEIRLQEGMEITEIFAQKGETYFRDLETQLLKNLQGREPRIISCGGGMPLRSQNAALMRQSGTVFWLTASPETVYERLKNDHTRPLLAGRNNPEGIAQLMEMRREAYEAACDVQVRTDGLTPGEIAAEIAETGVGMKVTD